MSGRAPDRPAAALAEDVIAAPGECIMTEQRIRAVNEMLFVVCSPEDDFPLTGEFLSGRRDGIDSDTKEILFVPTPDGLIAAIIGVWTDDGRFRSWVWYSSMDGAHDE